MGQYGRCPGGGGGAGGGGWWGGALVERLQSDRTILKYWGGVGVFRPLLDSHWS